VSRTDETYDAIKALVMDHLIPPGERVSIEGLSRLLHVSPTPVREALARLEAEGLVIKEPLRGNRTSPLLTRRQLDDLYGMRRLLEPWAARQAATTISPAGRQRLQAERASLSVPVADQYARVKSVADHDARFHDLIFELAGNELVRTMWGRTHCHLHLFRLYYAKPLGDLALEEHAAITEAICAGDPTGAEGAMLRHLEASRSRLLPAAVER
jgi:DNA-binding GntR family transcriptional regulator